MAKLESKIINWYQSQNSKEKLSFHEISEASNYMEWVLQALLRHKDSKSFLSQFDISADDYKLPFHEQSKFNIKLVQLSGLINTEIITRITDETTREELLNGLTDRQDQIGISSQIQDRLNFRYPYEEDKNIHTKMTVSEIKKLGQNVDDEDISKALIKEDIPVPLIPKFMAEKQELEGADRGTAYHKVLQLLNFKNIYSKEEIQSQILKMFEENKITKEAKDCISIQKIERLLLSEIGSRIKKADLDGKLYKERPFVIGVKASEISKHSESEDLILVQGIIDAYFEENGELIIVDYKTDFVTSEAELIQKYQIQLDYYAEALEKITEKKVREKIIYSVYMDRIIYLT